MPTPAERRALLFLASVAFLGAGVRALRGGQHGTPAGQASEGGGTGGGKGALAAQRATVDSVKRMATVRAVTARRVRSRASSSPSPDSARERGPAAGTATAPGPEPVDLDRADSAAIVRLPGIGPALARRIVLDRDSLGPFGSLAGLERVRGVGPRLAERLRPHVTFSLTPRPSSAVSDGPEPAAKARRSSRRRAPP